jgi:hypothetical protein
MPTINDKLRRFVAPTNLDYAEQGTVWRIDDNEQIYIQVSGDRENPNWISSGEFLHKIFFNKFKDKEFIDACYHCYRTTDFSKIINLLKKSPYKR